MTYTHTYAILEVSQEAYDEIRGRLNAAGYSDQFHDSAEGELVDMHGIALRAKAAGSPEQAHVDGNVPET